MRVRQHVRLAERTRHTSRIDWSASSFSRKYVGRPPTSKQKRFSGAGVGTAARGNSFGSSSFNSLGGFITIWGNVVVVVVVVVTTVVWVVGAKENWPTVVWGGIFLLVSRDIAGCCLSEVKARETMGVGMPVLMEEGRWCCWWWSRWERRGLETFGTWGGSIWVFRGAMLVMAVGVVVVAVAVWCNDRGCIGVDYEVVVMVSCFDVSACRFWLSAARVVCIGWWRWRLIDYTGRGRLRLVCGDRDVFAASRKRDELRRRESRDGEMFEQFQRCGNGDDGEDGDARCWVGGDGEECRCRQLELMWSSHRTRQGRQERGREGVLLGEIAVPSAASSQPATIGRRDSRLACPRAYAGRTARAYMMYGMQPARSRLTASPDTLRRFEPICRGRRSVRASPLPPQV